ncbi:PaaI family thioesterase [Campylobacter sp. RM16187]|uniref:PaaI family thioesterase n=1 Tax=Campylobacter sp. RM16187 TaxID=1660063 RepID=UPI0021B66165|nr:PaaI family thioesterase [Campylobacter sp. RM16187]QKG29071.1 acyl-CoA thioesterase [Campylobacter sp. RM16187]
MSDNIFDDSMQESVILPEDENPFRNELKTSPHINLSLSGSVVALGPNHAKTNFFATNEMVCDAQGLIHGGFVFSAASYAALASINETYSVMIGAKIHFYAPTMVNEMIEFDAHAHFGESKKREVRVIGKTKDIKVFEGTFQVVVLEDHILKIYKENIQKQATARRAEERAKETSLKN